MRVLFINDSTSNPNWGDRAAAISLKHFVQQAGGTITRILSESELANSQFSGRTASEDGEERMDGRSLVKLFIPPVLLRARRRLLSNPDANAASRMIPNSWEDFGRSLRVAEGKGSPLNGLLRQMEEVDVVVVHGDGAMVGNTILPRTELFLSYLAKTRFGLPTIIVNHTADFDHPALAEIARHVYPLCDDIVFRDHISVERCKSFCNGRYAADTAFWFEPLARDQWAAVADRCTYFDVWPDEASFDPRRPFVCIGGSSRSVFERPPFPIRRGYIAFLERLRGSYEGQIVLTASDLKDEAMFRPIAAEMGLPLASLRTPVQQAVDLLGNAAAYIGGRWHPSIFALRGGTPVIPLSGKTFKMEALTISAGLGTTTFDALNLGREAEGVIERLRQCLAEGDLLRSRLKQWAREMSLSCADNVALLGRLRAESASKQT